MAKLVLTFIFLLSAFVFFNLPILEASRILPDPPSIAQAWEK